ncbi:MAG: hypothetical protein ACKVLI_02435 [Alphaproteobacteria bacterium]|jgi:hypothetical protein|tara:strand:+ start:24636 stop:24821 length:186 start_codon:yes stop_codon:yes gene_type:complete
MDDNYTPTFDKNNTVNKVKRLVGYDWSADHKLNSNSIDVYHQGNTKVTKKFLIELAKSNTL